MNIFQIKIMVVQTPRWGVSIKYNNKNKQDAPAGHLYKTSKTIGSIIRGFKIGVTKWYR